MMANPRYQQAVRLHTRMLADLEKRLLVWMANRLPARIHSDHLTTAATLAMIGVGVCFWLGGGALPFVILLLGVNWFGDSLDGTLARVRRQERPRYGYYIDHVIDVAGTTLLFAGMACSGAMTPVIAVAVLAAYLLVSAQVFLATHARALFQISLWGFG